MWRVAGTRGHPSPVTLGDHARDRGDWEAAIGYYRRALARKPDNPPIWVQYGHALKERDHRLAAEAAYRRAIEGNPHSADAHLQLGHVLKLQGRRDEAKAAYLRASGLDPGLADAHRELAELGLKEDEIAAARAALPPLPRRRRRPSRITLADRARELGQWAEAARLYREVLARDPRNGPIWVQYGHALRQQDDLPGAEAAYRRARASDPKNADACLHLGQVFKLQGNIEDAEASYLAAFVLDPAMELPLAEIRQLGWSDAAISELSALMAEAALSTSESANQKGDDAPSCFSWTITDELRVEVTKRPKDEATTVKDKVRAISEPAAAPTIERPQDRRHVLPPTSRKFRVLFISGSADTPSHRYRVTHCIEALAEIGLEGEWIYAGDYEKGLNLLRRTSILVVFRVEYNPDLYRFIEAATALQVPVVFDVDDYVFEPNIATPDFIDGIRGWGKREIEGYRVGVRGYRANLVACQFATFTTGFLVERGLELKRRSFLLPNSLNANAIRLSNEIFIARQTKEDDGFVRIGYAGGTRTHQRDFAHCAPAVAAILRENPECLLVLFRDEREAPFLYTEEFPSFEGLEDRIEWRYFVPFDDVPYEVGRFDINLAPLEIGNAFCEAKSDLKFFEAACLGVPTVASATGVFSEAIAHGSTGYVAAAEKDWYQILTSLVRNRSLREGVGKAARARALELYSPTVHARRAQEVYSEIIKAHRAGIGRFSDALTITFILHKYTAGSLHHSPAILLMRALGQRGHDVELHFPENDKDIEDDVRREFELNHTVVISTRGDELRACDVAICNFWQTAFMLRDLPGLAQSRLYLLPDYEPLLYPMGEEYLVAEQSYRLGLATVAYGPGIKDKLKQELGIEVTTWIPFFVNKAIFYADPAIPRSLDRIVVFLRPDEGHYFSEFLISALDRFIKESNFTGTIEVFGSVSSIELPFPHIHHGAVSGPEMATLFREAALGVALSHSNPLPIALNMMACGLPIVDLDCDGKTVCYGGPNNAYLTAPNPVSLAQALQRLMNDNQYREALSRNGYNFTSLLPDETAAAAAFERLLQYHLSLDPRTINTPEAVANTQGVADTTLGPSTPVAVSAWATPQSTSRMRIDWILNGLEVGGGGTRNILRNAYYLEKFGHDVSLIFYVDGRSADNLKSMIWENFYPFQGIVKIYDGELRPSDAVIATHWETVSLALTAQTVTTEIMYFVQDFEPYFYPMSGDRLLAEETYRHGIYCICSGAWCSERLKRKYGAEADHFTFPLDTSVYFPRPKKSQRTSILFFARPEMPRRCFGVGVHMLRELHRLMPEIDIILFGSSHLDANSFDFPVVVRGVLPTLHDLAEMYSDADLGIAFALTNPSLVPYEMMACGLPVVDIARPETHLNYGGRTDIAFLASSVPVEMARQIAGLLSDREHLRSRSRRGQEFVSTFPNEEQTARRVEQLIADKLARRKSDTSR